MITSRVCSQMKYERLAEKDVRRRGRASQVVPTRERRCEAIVFRDYVLRGKGRVEVSVLQPVWSALIYGCEIAFRSGNRSLRVMGLHFVDSFNRMTRKIGQGYAQWSSLQSGSALRVRKLLPQMGTCPGEIPETCLGLGLSFPMLKTTNLPRRPPLNLLVCLRS